MSTPTNPVEPLRVREVAWLELFPWLRLIGTLGLALKVRMLLLATTGLLLTLFGWWLLASAFAGNESVKPLVAAYQSCVWNGDSSGVSGVLVPVDDQPGPHLAHWPALPFRDLWWKLSAPMRQFFANSTTFTGGVFLLLCTLWSLAVWAIFGGAMARMAALAIGREQNATIGEGLRFARSKWGAYVAAPLMPLTGAMLVGLPLMLAGLLMRTDILAALIGLAWPVMLLGGLLVTVFLLGLFFGWPLLFASISTEATDSFDAVSRTYSYVQQRPWNYLWYALVASVVSWFGALLADNFASAVIHFTQWMVSCGSGQVRIAVLTRPGGDLFAAKAIWFWTGAVRVVALGFLVSHFWVAATAIYLLLRQDTDGAELDEVFVENAGETHGLPPVEFDAQGVTVVPKSETVVSEEPA
jgi:hypothetical protein